jgi:hypothetical protein
VSLVISDSNWTLFKLFCLWQLRISLSMKRSCESPFSCSIIDFSDIALRLSAGFLWFLLNSVQNSLPLAPSSLFGYEANFWESLRLKSVQSEALLAERRPRVLPSRPLDGALSLSFDSYSLTLFVVRTDALFDAIWGLCGDGWRRVGIVATCMIPEARSSAYVLLSAT